MPGSAAPTTGPRLCSVSRSARRESAGGRGIGKNDYVRNCCGALNQRPTTWSSARAKRLIVDGDRAVVFFQGVGGLGRNGIDYSMECRRVMHVTEDRIDEVIGFHDGNKVSALFG